MKVELQVDHICSSSGRLARQYAKLYQAETPRDPAKLVLTDVCLPLHACFDRFEYSTFF